MNRVLFLFACVGISREIASADKQTLLIPGIGQGISVSVLIFSEDNRLKGKVHEEKNMSVTTTVADLAGLLRDIYLIGSLKIGARRYMSNQSNGMYYYSGTFDRKKTLASIIQEFKTNEFYAVCDYTSPKNFRARSNSRSNSYSLAVVDD